jgi:MFS family permease
LRDSAGFPPDFAASAPAGDYVPGATSIALAVVDGQVVETLDAASPCAGRPRHSGLGEALLAPTLPALVNDLAPGELRGRYNAVSTLSWQIGPVLGPALAGLMLGNGHGTALLLLLAAGCTAPSWPVR